MNGRYFLFNAGIGLDAAVIARVDRRRALKRWAAHPLFVWSAATTWARHYERARPSVAVMFPEVAEHDAIEGYFVLVLNSDPYTFLGDRPLHLVPSVSLESALALVTFRTLAAVPFLRAVGSALGMGRAADALPGLDVRTDVESFEVRALGAPLPAQVDGEYLGEVERASFRYERDVLRVVFPGA
jgi:diacylglycerol kinase family enzyme